MKAWFKKTFLNEQKKASYRKIGAWTVALCAGLLGATTQGLVLPQPVKAACIIVACLAAAAHQVGTIAAKDRQASK